MATKKELEDPFYQGVCCALAVVHGFGGEETIWREIAKDCGGYDLLRAVSKHGDNLDIDGFNEYRKESR